MKVEELIELLLELPLDAHVTLIGSRQEPDAELVYDNPVMLTDGTTEVMLAPDYLVYWVKHEHPYLTTKGAR